MSSFLEHYDALNLMGEKLAPHVDEYDSMSDIIKMLLTESQKISLEELCNELGLPVQHDEGDVKNGKRKQTKKQRKARNRMLMMRMSQRRMKELRLEASLSVERSVCHQTKS